MLKLSALLLFVSSMAVLVSSLWALWIDVYDLPNDPLEDAYEAHWAEVFRVCAYVFAVIGVVGVVLAGVMVWPG